MEILKILTESAKDLYPEDLDFFETELATGDGYDDDYRSQCLTKISELRAWMNGGSAEEDPASQPAAVSHSTKKKGSFVPNGLVKGISSIAPAEANSAAAAMTPAQQVDNDLKALREQSSYKSSFKKYVKSSAVINETFLENHFSLFRQWELGAVVSVIPLSEEFLENYFGALDHEKIARYQLFSESFFMKHFSQLDASLVLEHGKNEWRRKENRSKQLDVFLRLKGVKI